MRRGKRASFSYIAHSGVFIPLTFLMQCCVFSHKSSFLSQKREKSCSSRIILVVFWHCMGMFRSWLSALNGDHNADFWCKVSSRTWRSHAMRTLRDEDFKKKHTALSSFPFSSNKHDSSKCLGLWKRFEAPGWQWFVEQCLKHCLWKCMKHMLESRHYRHFIIEILINHCSSKTEVCHLWKAQSLPPEWQQQWWE